jgi:hypothetical protein
VEGTAEGDALGVIEVGLAVVGVVVLTCEATGTGVGLLGLAVGTCEGD